MRVTGVWIAAPLYAARNDDGVESGELKVDGGGLRARDAELFA